MLVTVISPVVVTTLIPQRTLVFFADQGCDVVLEAVAVTTSGEGRILYWVQLCLELKQTHLQ